MWKKWKTPTKCNSPLNNYYGLCTLQGYGHVLQQTLIGLRKPLMVHDNGMCTSGKKWIKMRMKTPIHLNSKGNEIIIWCSFTIWSCLFLNSHYSYMCYHHQCLLHHICVSWFNNDNIHQGSEVLSGDKDIHSSSSVANEKVGDLLLNMCSIFRSNSYDNISKYIVGYYMLISTRALKQMGT